MTTPGRRSLALILTLTLALTLIPTPSPLLGEDPVLKVNLRRTNQLRPLTCERVAAQILSLGAAFGGLAGGFEGAGATA